MTDTTTRTTTSGDPSTAGSKRGRKTGAEQEAHLKKKYGERAYQVVTENCFRPACELSTKDFEECLSAVEREKGALYRKAE